MRASWRFVLGFCVLPIGAMAATPSGITTTESAFVAALNGTNPLPFAALFAPQASITDTLPPFNWQGKAVPARYFAALQAVVKAAGWADLQLAPRGASTVLVDHTRAYDAVPLYVNYAVKGAKKQDSGFFTLTLSEIGKAWKITSATWTYTSPPPM